MIPILKDNWLFKSLSKEEIDQAIKQGQLTLLRYDKGNLVHLAGTHCNSIEIILSGSVQIEHIDTEGHLLYITKLKKGSTIGSVLLFATNSEYPFNITAHEPLELLIISRDSLTALFSKHFQLYLAFLTNLSDQSKMLTKTIHNLSEKTLRQKITQYLIDGSAKQNSKTVYLDISKKRLSEQMGVARTSLSRELQKMAIDGLIQVNGSYITLLK